MPWLLRLLLLLLLSRVQVATRARCRQLSQQAAALNTVDPILSSRPMLSTRLQPCSFIVSLHRDIVVRMTVAILS